MRILKRRKERKTDYTKRIALLKSNSPRITFRKTNKYIIAQYIRSDEAKDRSETGVTSKILLSYGWPKEFEGSLKSIPASYLTGFALGKKISGNKIDKPVVDLGMTKKIHKSRFFAFLKGLKDSGIKIKCDEDFFPQEDKIKGKNLKKDFSKNFDDIKNKINDMKK